MAWLKQCVFMIHCIAKSSADKRNFLFFALATV